MAQHLPIGDLLSGAESQRLRTFCSQETYTSSDLDDYAHLLSAGDLAPIRADFEDRVRSSSLQAARKAIAEINYGPTKVPVYNFLLQLTLLNPPLRINYVRIVEYLAKTVKVPVDTPDLSGNTTLMYSISTKPYLDFEIADILLKAGGDINKRNRYGCVAAHDIVMVGEYSEDGKRRSCAALQWFMGSGGDVDIVDGDGISARSIGLRLRAVVSEFGLILGAGGNTNGNTNGGGSGVKGKKVKVGRNEPCPCGSKKKYKVCCGRN